jgi:hypothetical protein
MSLYLSPGEVRRDLTPNDLSAIQEELQSSAAPLAASTAAPASGDTSAMATASDVPAALSASGPGAVELAGVAAAGPEAFSVPAGAIPSFLGSPTAPGLEATGDHQDFQAGPTLLSVSPVATGPGGAQLLAAVSPGPILAAAAVPAVSIVTGQPSVSQGFNAGVSSAMLAAPSSLTSRLETLDRSEMADRLYGLALAEFDALPLGASYLDNLRTDLGGVPQSITPADPFGGDHQAPSVPAPAAIAIAPLPMPTVPAVHDIVADALDAILLEGRSQSEATSDELMERVDADKTNTPAVVMGVMALAWRYRSHLGSQGDDRDRRQGRAVPRFRLPGPGPDRNTARDSE